MKNFADRIAEHLGQDGYEPVKRHDLAEQLGISAEERSAFRRVLRQLEEEGRIVRLRKNRLALAAAPRASRTGRLRVHPDGYGVIKAADNDEEFIVPADRMGQLLNGDTVRFEPVNDATAGRRLRRSQRAARVIEVVERFHQNAVGLLMKTPSYDYVIPDHADLPDNIRVRGYAPGLDETVPAFHKVLLSLDAPLSGGAGFSGVVLEDLGHEDDPGVDVLSIVRRKGIPTSHTAAVTQAVRDMVPLRGADSPERRDLRGKTIFTIDPFDAKDFDDAVSLEKLDDGRLLLGVHIADVSHYVEAGTPVDAESLLRGNSVYLVDRVIPMLPAYLTTEICSLVPNEDRLTHSVEIILTAEGEVEAFSTFPSLIHSVARLNYDQVQVLLNSRQSKEIPSALQPVILEMHELASRLRARRMENGSVAFNLPEVKCLLDAHGVPSRITRRVEYEAYQLIEEFMLLANQLVAQRLLEQGVPGMYRIHPAPDQEQWKRMAAELHTLGVSHAPTNRAEINRVAAALRGKPVEYPASISILRNFKQAVYSADCDPHFGLAFDHYTHFTSPIRRYPDLVAHRLLKAIEQGRPRPYEDDQLREIARQCSATERAAMEAERESLNLKRIQYYAARFAKGDRGPHKAIVAAIIPLGLIVEVLDTLQHGLIHFSALGHDHYVINEHRTRAVGRRDKEVYAIGMPFDVEVVRVDERKNQIDFRLARRPVSARPNRRNKRIKRERG